jgi:PilZ domain
MPKAHKKQIMGTQSGVWALQPKTSSFPAIEQRAFARHFCEIGAVVDSWPARIENISLGGLKVVIGRRFEVDTILKLEIGLQGEENLSMLLVRVVRVMQEPAGSWGLGCAFSQEISEEQLQESLNEDGPKK